jgi:phosphoglycerate dehydrogenase-like enzyme
MNVRIGVLIPVPLRDKLFKAADCRRLETLGEVAWNDSNEHLAPEHATRLLSECDIAIGSWGTAHPATPGLIAACPRLRLWEHVAGSVKHMFGPHLQDRDLAIASCKGAIAECVAEQVIGALIVGLRCVIENASANRQGPARIPKGLRVLNDSTIGVIGASEVGKRVIRLLQPFGCEVLCYDPFADPATLGVELVSDLAELCARCHALTLHTPKLSATEKLVGARELAAMRDGALFINTSSGLCVDQAALTRELESGRLHAWLDVTTPEPLPAEHILRTLPNVILTSHIAGPATSNMGRQAVDDVAAFIAGGMPQCVINASMLERTA